MFFTSVVHVAPDLLKSRPNTSGQREQEATNGRPPFSGFISKASHVFHSPTCTIEFPMHSAMVRLLTMEEIIVPCVVTAHSAISPEARVGSINKAAYHHYFDVNTSI